MISLWFFAWLWQYLSPGPETWWAVPMVVTAAVSTGLEAVGYTAVIVWAASRSKR